MNYTNLKVLRKRGGNMKKKIILGSIGAVVIALLIVSSATAVTTTQDQNENQEKIMHIDSNIKITKKYEQKLMDAYNNIDDPDFKILLGKIIDLFETKKVVTSVDIKTIIDENNLSVRGAYFARIINTNEATAGRCGPHLIRLYWGCFLYWIADTSYFPEWPHISVTVGPDTYTGNHKGLAVSYFGFAWNGAGFGNGHPQVDFSLGGFGFLIFVSP
jgi:hypothetical protein